VSERDIGRHEEAINSLKGEVHAMREQVSEIREILATARGGWKTLVAVGSISSAITTGVIKILAMIKGGA
jgi:archaellum component FlaC